MLRPVTRFDVEEYGSPRVGEVPTADPNSPAARFALDAAAEALGQAGLGDDTQWVGAAGVVLGTCLGESGSAFHWLRTHASGSREPAPLREWHGTLAAPTAGLAGVYGLTGPVLTVSTACTSGTSALALAADCIRRGEADVMLAGGVDVLCRFVVSGFWLLRALASETVRPFDRRRDGLALGEGAGILVLEERDRALERGASPLAEIVGCGSWGTPIT